ncbi:leucine-rich repeat-containing protein let-4-like [Topomyia yanbarensis]|uniref:leucine-rich repeat-containing protein let-4-like n=1 Tax=Topomyia yanbarensis TaxID=2498891 RepID=UPI00273B7850|nr:leucine-rich repeat-containing protein let-4-like [Topomyia yanbarensis]
MKSIIWLRIITSAVMSMTAAMGITLKCLEQDYYSRNCTYDGVKMVDLVPNVEFSNNYYTPNYFKFVHSELIEIPKRIFERYPSMTSLNVANSSVKSVSRYTFERASALVLLNMSTNNLQEIQSYVFSGAIQLTVLDLSKNNISSIDEKAFSGLNTLHTLLLSSNRLKILKDNVFSPLGNLQKLSMARNNLEVLEKDLFATNSRMTMLFLHNNQLVVIEQDLFKNVNELEYLWLKNNNLTSLEISISNVKRVNVMNNQLIKIKINTAVQELYLSNNSISEIVVDDFSDLQLKTLDLSWNKISSLDVISKIASLQNLDLSHNKIGPLNLTSFAKLSTLVDLNLEDSQISNLQYGTFSQLTSLQRLDISYNNLNRINFDIFTSSHLMDEIYIEGNRLKDINYEEIQKIFPSLKKISIADNNWNCSYLTKMIRTMNGFKIVVGGFKTETLIADKTNVKGIYCSDDKNPVASWNVTAKHLDKYLNDSVPIVDTSEIKQIMQNAIDDVGRFNEYKVSLINRTDQLEGEIFDLTKKFISLESENYELKKTILDVRLSMLVNASNETVASSDLKKAMQELNELTLAKMKQLENNLEFKIYQQSFKFDKMKESIEETAGKLLVLSKQMAPNAGFYNHLNPTQQELKAASAGSGSSQTVIIIMLVILVAMLTIVLVVIYRNRFSVGPSRGSRFGTSNTLATIVDNDI